MRLKGATLAVLDVKDSKSPTRHGSSVSNHSVFTHAIIVNFVSSKFHSGTKCVLKVTISIL